MYAVVSPNHSFSLVAHHAGWRGVGLSRKGLAALHIISFVQVLFIHLEAIVVEMLIRLGVGTILCAVTSWCSHKYNCAYRHALNIHACICIDMHMKEND